ncbi:MAG: hypothetical protein NT013_18425 [Planctomycetia bacterium]|nr:hypothetical protein [Planctomycetia bacterium]
MAKWHPQKEVSDAIEYAVSQGWRFIKGSGHCFGTLRCPQADRDGHQFRVFSTPQNPGAHARRLRHAIDACTHEKGA